MSKKHLQYDLTQVLNATLRNDFLAFAMKVFDLLNPGKKLHMNWALMCIAYQLQLCVVSGQKRLILCVPPRHLKSMLASVALIAWILGRDPNQRVIGVSYSQELAKKFHQDCHHVIESDFYQQVFPGMHLADKPNNDQEYATTQHGSRLATSVGGTLTGRGGDFIIIDDPIKPQEAQSEAERKKLHTWFGDTLITRLDNPAKGVVIIVTQRTHMDDLVGHVKEHGDWKIVNIPAIGEIEETYEIGPNQFYVRKPGTVIDPERQTLDDLKALKKSMTPYFFAAQYQQEPMVLGGGIIKFDWLKRVELMPGRGAFDFVVQVWDTASETKEINDYSVCGTFGVLKHDYYLLDVFRDRLGYTELKAEAFRLGHTWRPDASLIEGAGIGPALRADLLAKGYRHVWTQSPTESKTSRVLAQLDKLAAGRVHIPLVAPWQKDLREEMLLYPYGKHDDQIDVLEAFLRNVDRVRHLLVVEAHPTAGRYFRDGLPGALKVRVTIIR